MTFLTDIGLIKMALENFYRIDKIVSQHSLDEINKNYLLSDSLQFNFEKIYSDLSKLSGKFLIEMDFRLDELRAIRNRIAHDYESVALSILFDTAKNDLPELRRKLEQLLSKGENYEQKN